MLDRLKVVAVALVAAFCSLAAAANEGAVNTPIKVDSCYALAAGHGGESTTFSGIMIRFRNMTSTTLRQIVWRASTPAGTMDLIDTGVFSPGVSIRTELGRRGSGFHGPLHSTMEVIGPGVCTAIEFRDANGNITKEPAPAPVPFYVPPVPPDSATPVPASIDNPSRDPVGVVSCAFSIVFGRAYGHVRFRNLSSQVIDRIRFRAFYGMGGIDFDKTGSFAPGVLIDTGDMSRRDLPPHAYSEYVTLDAPSSCTAVEAHYTGGTSWTNPSVGPTEPPFPQM